MKVSTRVEYGLVALTDIAINSAGGKTVSSSDISVRQNISQKYLEQIIIALRQGGFVKGRKGSQGGYVLSRSAESILLSDILDALDNSILADSCENTAENPNDIRSSVNSCLWSKINSNMRRFAREMTLADLIKEYNINLSRSSDYMYYI